MAPPRRIHTVRPGYVCPNATDHAACADRSPDHHHGRHGDEWWYAVAFDDVALVLQVYTAYLGSQMLWDAPSYGADLTTHTAFPCSREEIVDGASDSTCEYLLGKRCYWSYAPGGASQFFTMHGDPAQAEQSESFWRAMEARLVDVAEQARATRADREWRLCPTCKGERTIAACAIAPEAGSLLPIDLTVMRDPVARALARHLEHGNPNAVIMRHCDGRPVTAARMLVALQLGEAAEDDDALAVREFLRATYGAALTTLRVRQDRTQHAQWSGAPPTAAEVHVAAQRGVRWAWRGSASSAFAVAELAVTNEEVVFAHAVDACTGSAFSVIKVGGWWRLYDHDGNPIPRPAVAPGEKLH